jgi:hypothetical protein
MPDWLPKLTLPDLGVVLLTIGLCMAASRVNRVGDLIGKLFGRGSKTPPRR